ncbi:Fc.00g025710.m01.CDS01 [Cosmosporella sp. VM-42]
MGVSTCPHACLRSNGSNGGIFGELIKALTFWSSVVSSAKALTSNLTARITDIHVFDEKISNWWRNMLPELKLTPSNIAAVPGDTLPKILLVNLVYHQSLCVLHASIVPLFCWGPGDNAWSSARQLSAQVAFEHACEVSTLIDAVISNYPQLSAMPSFVAYAAYCGCAIQIPFMWCLNPAVQERARANVKANVRMIYAMATYWTFAKLLKTHVRCLYTFHKNYPTILEDEPKYINPSILADFNIKASHARTSILEFTGILQGSDGYAKPGEETEDLGIENEPPVNGPRSAVSPLGSGKESVPDLDLNAGDFGSTPRNSQDARRLNSTHDCHTPRRLMSPLISDRQNFTSIEGQTLEVFNLFLDSEMLDLLPAGGMPDLSQFETNDEMSFDMDSWDDFII